MNLFQILEVRIYPWLGFVAVFLQSCSGGPVATMVNAESGLNNKNLITEIPSITLTKTDQLISTPFATPSPVPTMNSTSFQNTALPEEHYIMDISGHKQYFSLGCEASAAVDVAQYFGLTINEFEFQFRLPLSDNPDLGFVGSVNGPWGQIPPYAYGVHAGPVADLLTDYGLSAEGIKHFTLDQIKSEIVNGRPVIAWVIGNVVGGVPYEYTDKDGSKVVVAAYEHVIIITGFNKLKIRYMSNGNFYDTPYETFLNSWGILGNMAVIIKDQVK